jgi:hypothetical protein
MRSTSSPRADSMMIGTLTSARRSLGDVESGLARQHDVEDHEVGVDLLEHELGAVSVAGGVDLVARLGQRVVYDFEDRLLVIDDQDSFTGALPGPAWPYPWKRIAHRVPNPANKP